jgi:perosamine synthetase
MIPRGKLDIRFADLLKGALYCISSKSGLEKKELHFPEKQLPCLSVRTGFNLVLGALNLEPGSEILVTDINIPDMFAIINAHHFKAIPLGVDGHTLGISAAQVQQNITPKTKVLLITHLFGAVMDTAPLLQVAKLNNLIVIEDCAQAFDSVYSGNSQSDIVMFSFGLIKTNTCLNGAMLSFKSAELFASVKKLNDELPVQPTRRYLKKIINATLINLFTLRLPYTLAYWICELINKDFDAFITGFTRGFPGGDVLRKISYRPCNANLHMLQYRLNNFDKSIIYKRKALANRLLKDLKQQMTIGHGNLNPTHWVIPVEVAAPELLVNHLRDRGFDATSKASSLVKLNGTISPSKRQDELVLDNLVYLPMDIKMTEREANLLNQLLLDYTSRISS